MGDFQFECICIKFKLKWDYRDLDDEKQVNASHYLSRVEM